MLSKNATIRSPIHSPLSSTMLHLPSLAPELLDSMLGALHLVKETRLAVSLKDFAAQIQGSLR